MGDGGARLTHRGDQREGIQIGRVAGYDRVFRGMAVDLVINDALHIGFLDHGFDHEIGVADRVRQRLGIGDPLKRCPGIGSRDRARIDKGGAGGFDEGGRGPEHLGAAVMQADPLPAKRVHQRQSVAHRACADNGYFLNTHQASLHTVSIKLRRAANVRLGASSGSICPAPKMIVGSTSISAARALPALKGVILSAVARMQWRGISSDLDIA